MILFTQTGGQQDLREAFRRFLEVFLKAVGCQQESFTKRGEWLLLSKGDQLHPVATQGHAAIVDTHCLHSPFFNLATIAFGGHLQPLDQQTTIAVREFK